ncbi:MAG: hypothetical protein PHO64_01660 [Thiomonas sp.]|nr:hypothetical protein [Thiomonas sp.]
MQTANTTMTAIFGEPISTYSRADALEDGVLIDISATAREAGIVWPIAMTAAAWADCVQWTDADEARKGYTGQSEAGRLWDVCWMLSAVLRRAARQGLRADPAHPLYVELLRTPREGRGVKPRLVHLKFIIGPDDDGRPCITVMMPGED